MSLKIPKVLVVSRRTSELCATKAMLNMAGFDVAVVTNLETACALGRCLPYRAAVVCKHSFTAQERDQLAAELAITNPELQVIAKCSGCLGCDEGRADVIGTLPEEDPAISQVMVALGRCRC